MITAKGSTYSFAGYVLDLRRGLLHRDDHQIDLRPKCFELLRRLVENAGRLVPKEELMQAVWPNVAVTDESLARCVSDLRLALGDGERGLIRTIRGRGLLFSGVVLLEESHPGMIEDEVVEAEPSQDVGSKPTFTDLVLPLIGQILSTTAMRGPAYEGFYRSIRPYAAIRGAFIHDNILVRMAPDGVLRLKMATGGVFVDGWVLPVLTQLYVIGTEFGTGGLVFAILHGVSSVKAEVLDGITLSSTFDAGRTPAASAILLNRTSDLSGDPQADDARLASLGSANPVASPESVPDDLRRHLTRDLASELRGVVSDGVLRLPLAGSRTQSAPFDPE